MSKRQCTGDAPTAPASKPDAEAEPTSLTYLADWCDDKLRETGEAYLADSEVTTSCTTTPNSAYAEWVDERFEDFWDEMHQQQRIGLKEINKGHVAKLWREAATDAARVYEYRDATAVASRFRHYFFSQSLASEACGALERSAEEPLEEWVYGLGYTLAEGILNLGAEELSSDEDAASDEPVDESDSGDGVSGEEESAESAEGSASEEGSESSDD